MFNYVHTELNIVMLNYGNQNLFTSQFMAKLIHLSLHDQNIAPGKLDQVLYYIIWAILRIMLAYMLAFTTCAFLACGLHLFFFLILLHLPFDLISL
jgi:hypothetical protein